MARKQKSAQKLKDALKKMLNIRAIALAALGLIIASFVFGLAVSGVTRIKNPATALAFYPGESTALAARADQLFFLSPEKPDPKVRIMAVAALRQQAVNAKALRLLGYVADAAGNADAAEVYIREAAKISRRETGAQLWLIEAMARKNDTERTLVHYDISLRTKPDTQAILFPRLLKAIEDAEVRVAMKHYVRMKRNWAAAFLAYANTNSKNLSALVDFVVETGGLADREAARHQQLALLLRLVNEGHFADARRIYSRLPGAKERKLVDVGFDSSDRDGSLGAMGWQILDNPDSGGNFAAIGKNQTALSIFANSGTTRAVATKLLYLRPGLYTFAGKLSTISRGDGGFIRWQLRCMASSSEEPQWKLDSESAELTAGILVPDNCPIQHFIIIASGGKAQTGMEATISTVSLQRS